MKGLPTVGCGAVSEMSCLFMLDKTKPQAGIKTQMCSQP